MELLTNSAISSFRTCVRKHHYEFELGLRPVQAAQPLRFGTVCHAALEAYWRARKAAAETAESGDAARAGWLAARHAMLTNPLDDFAKAKLGAMLEVYFEVWSAEQVTVLEVEREFTAPLCNPDSTGRSQTFVRAGKIDLILRLADGRIALVEHKSSGNEAGPGSEYRSRLSMDSQVSMYFRGAESIGLAPDLCIYDVLRKPSIAPLEATPIESRKYTQEQSRACAICRRKNAPAGPHRDEKTGTDCVNGRVITDPGGKLYANMRATDETPAQFRARCLETIASALDEYIVRIEVPRLESEMAQADRDVWFTAQMMLAARRFNSAPRSPAACMRYGSTCAYLPLCDGRASESDTTLYQITKRNPELAGSPEAA